MGFRNLVFSSTVSTAKVCVKAWMSIFCKTYGNEDSLALKDACCKIQREGAHMLSSFDCSEIPRLTLSFNVALFCDTSVKSVHLTPTTTKNGQISLTYITQRPEI